MTPPAPPRVLVDIGHSRSPHVGLGQVAMQYARALVAARPADLRFRFLAHPGFRAFPAAVPDADLVPARFSPLGAALRLFSREHSRRVSAEAGHALRHALHRNFHPPHSADRAPFVLTIHDMHFLHHANPEPVLRQLQSAVAAARALVFISNHARAVAAEHLDFSGKLLRVIHNGVEKPAVGARPAWLPDDRPFLLSVAAVVPHKNHAVLPAMMRALPEYNLVVVGRKKPPAAEQVERAARAQGVADRVLLPGPVGDGEKAWLLRACAGFVFPSLREGFGMPVVEALHFGKPVFCLRNTALPEVGGPVACYWEHCAPEHMAQVVRENLPANPPAEQARRAWAAQFSWQKNAAAHLKLYRQLLTE